MKKILLIGGIVLVLLIIAGILGVTLFLDSGVKRAVETVGPRLTSTDVKLQGVTLSLLSGSGQIKGMTIGNPEGFKSPQAMSVGSASLALKPRSVFSDKVIINKIELIEPEITFELGLGGNNLKKLLANIEAATGGSSTTAPSTKEEKAASRKLQVDDFTISGAKVQVVLTELTGQSVSATLPTIHLTGLGTGPEGITAGELSKRVLREIEKEAAKVAANKMPELTQAASELGQRYGISTNTVQAIGRGIGDLLKKKQGTN